MKSKEFKFKIITPKTMSDSVKNLQAQHNLKNKEMAAIIKMSAQNYSNFVNNKVSMKLTLQQVYNLMQHFGLPFEYFIGEKVSENPEIERLNEKVKDLHEQLEIVKENNAFYRADLQRCREQLSTKKVRS